MTNHQSLVIFGFLSLLFANSALGLPHFFPNISSIPSSLIPNVSAAAGAWEAFQNFSGCHSGENVNGLSKMKKYFQYFGYLNNSSMNFTDDFDDALESAIKTYQLNFNLNVTGELDEPTLKQLTKPRCGNADIVNGSSSMKSGGNNKTTSSGSIHVHAVAHYTFFPGSPRWPARKSVLTYAFVPENQLTDQVKRVFSRAFQRWAAVIPLNFTETPSFQTADIKIGFFSGNHGDEEPFDGVLGTLAHAFSPPSGRFHLDADETWIVDGGGSTAISAVDLESVAVHEIGHLLGLGHSSVAEAIMFPTISSLTRKVELAGDDIEGIQVLYGSNPNFNGSVTPSTQQRDTTSNNSGAHSIGPLWGLRLLVAVGFVLLIL